MSDTSIKGANRNAAPQHTTGEVGPERPGHEDNTSGVHSEADLTQSCGMGGGGPIRDPSTCGRIRLQMCVCANASTLGLHGPRSGNCFLSMRVLTDLPLL